MHSCSPPRITIGIPTYNRARGHLTDALRSALSQTYPHVEVVVSDNCSTDDTAQVVADFTDARVRYVRQTQNIGANGNFNACLREARGDYFLLLHDDDLIDVDFVTRCVHAANYSTRYGFLRTGTRVIDAVGRTLRELPNGTAGGTREEFFLSWLRGATAVFLCTTLFNTRALRQIGGFRSKHNLFEDGRALVHLCANWPWVDIPDVMGSFRFHADQRTFTVNIGKWCEEFRSLLDLMTEQAPEWREEIIQTGLPFFARLALNRARTVEPRWRRVIAHVVVARYFPVRYWPRGYTRRMSHLFGR